MQTDESPVRLSFTDGGKTHFFSFPKFHLHDDKAFFDFCQDNGESWLSFEREADGEVRLMPPSGSETGYVNAEILTELNIWNRQQGRPGYVFDSSAGFILPNGAVRAPDICFVLRERYEALTEEERRHHAPLAPDFVIEVMSPTDRLRTQQAKMKEYIENGVRLGWLIHRKERIVYVYRPDTAMEPLSDPGAVSADPELPGFSLSMERIFRSGR